MLNTIFDIGTVAIFLEEGTGRPSIIRGFTLPDDAKVPEEFKVGDEVDLTNHPSPPDQVAMGHITGYYEIRHVKSGKILKTWHKDDIYKVPGY
jgi:hypothetical protein